MPPKRPSSSTTDTQLGLTPEDLATFRRHQHLALGQAPTTSTSRVNATAEAQRSFVLDSSSLQLMTRHFDRIIITIQQRLDTVSSGLRRDHRCLIILIIHSCNARRKTTANGKLRKRAFLSRLLMLKSHECIPY